MASLFELRKQKTEAIAKASAIVDRANTEKRRLSGAEQIDYSAVMTEIAQLEHAEKTIESKNTISRMVGPAGTLLTDGVPNGEKRQPRVFTREYLAAQTRYFQTNGREVSADLAEYQDALGGFPLAVLRGASAALYEGSDTGGGYAVPIVVDDQIVPLAPSEMAVRQLATVIPTVSDIKFPVKASFGTTTAKAETSSFGESELSLGQFTLSAFMAGNNETLSWELAQDVPAFQATTVDDLILGQQMYEENLYVNGNGSGQAQGLVGNVGAGVTEEPDTNGNLVSINATLDVMGTLNAVYHKNASWLMSRPTSIGIRKAQVESNLFNPVWQRVGQQDFLHGYPVYYSASMPAAARGASPVLFGDFKRGYIIGDRGGSGINVKVLDQPKALQGEIVLLAYRRTDGRVRRSEAIQTITISAS